MRYRIEYLAMEQERRVSHDTRKRLRLRQITAEEADAEIRRLQRERAAIFALFIKPQH